MDYLPILYANLCGSIWSDFLTFLATHILWMCDWDLYKYKIGNHSNISCFMKIISLRRNHIHCFAFHLPIDRFHHRISPFFIEPKARIILFTVVLAVQLDFFSKNQQSFYIRNNLIMDSLSTVWSFCPMLWSFRPISARAYSSPLHYNYYWLVIDQ